MMRAIDGLPRMGKKIEIAAAHRECIPRISVRLALHTECELHAVVRCAEQIYEALQRVWCMYADPLSAYAARISTRVSLLRRRHDTSSYIARFTVGEGWKFRVETLEGRLVETFSTCARHFRTTDEMEKFPACLRRITRDNGEQASRFSFSKDLKVSKRNLKNNGQKKVCDMEYWKMKLLTKVLSLVRVQSIS